MMNNLADFQIEKYFLKIYMLVKRIQTIKYKRSHMHKNLQ